MQKIKSSRLLRRLNKVYKEFSVQAAVEKISLLCAFENRSVKTAAQLLELHEILCFLRAYPDNPEVFKEVENLLNAFHKRKDLDKHREELANSGVVGTPIYFRFFWPMARWLAETHSQRLYLDWAEMKDTKCLMSLLPVLLPELKTSEFENFERTPMEWFMKLNGADETDATFLMRRLDTIFSNAFEREALHNFMDLSFKLKPGRETPSRTLGQYKNSPIVYQESHSQNKPVDLHKILRQKPLSIRHLSPRQGEELINLAREAMLTRERDHDAFSYGNKHDVRLVDYADGFQFACIGIIPERRYLLPAYYGFLSMNNGIPIGYFQVNVLFKTAELPFHIFENFRGVETTLIYARAITLTHLLFNAQHFVVDPYQLGQDNEDALAAGVWWFYYKMGFRSRDREIRQIVRRELKKKEINPNHRSSHTTLSQLANEYLSYDMVPRKSPVNKLTLTWDVEMGVSANQTRWGSNRELGIQEASAEVAKRLGLRSFKGFNRAERQAWDRWSTLLVNFRGMSRWSKTNRLRVIDIVRAKGAHCEGDYVKLFDRHTLLQSAIEKFTTQMEI